MLTLVAIAAVLLEAAASPVYNMQPAFITANIGTAGRNIRNLPCISRKSNQRGVCMFAIDCMKGNGTHLGTCIDRFYFGSCCHFEPVHDIIENTIDTDIIPAREPPQRLSSTIKPISTTRKTTTTEKPKPSTDEATTVSYKLTTFQSVDGFPTETTTKSTTTKPTTVKTTPKPTKPTTKATPKPTTTRKPSTKPTTTTRKPSPTTKKPSPTTKKPSTTTKKPSATTRKPSTTTTKKPSTTTTKKPSTTTTKKPSTTTTRKPSTTTTTTTKKPVATTTKPTTTTTTTPRTTTTRKPSTTPSTTTSTTTPKPTTIAEKNITQVLESVATNEIETVSSSTTKPATSTAETIVTWAIVESEKNVSTTSSPGNSTSEDEWQPVTTPDKWVPLPSVQPSTTEAPSVATTESKSTTSTASPVTTTPVSTTTDQIRPVNMSDFTDVCGRRMYPEGRIVGGEKSTFGKWPWQISLRQWRTSTYLHKCGAALLNENWAITAAHCVDNVPPSDLLLRLGEHDLSTESEPYLHQERRVQIVASHPQFDPRTFEYDLALLRFYEPVTFQPNILPVCVPQSDENFVGRTAYVTGWGRLYEDGPLPSILQEVSVPVINNSVCESMYRSAGYIEHIPHIFICAGWRRGGFDSCEGDSGGPMVIQREDKRFLLAGIISWGIGCAEPNQPGVYTRISEFRDWINQILQF